MNKSELSTKLAQECNLSTDDAGQCVSIFVDEMRKALLEGNRIEIRGFRQFQDEGVSGLYGPQPETGEKVAVNPKRMPFFRAGKELKDYVNEEAS